MSKPPCCRPQHTRKFFRFEISCHCGERKNESYPVLKLSDLFLSVVRKCSLYFLSGVHQSHPAGYLLRTAAFVMSYTVSQLICMVWLGLYFLQLDMRNWQQSFRILIMSKPTCKEVCLRSQWRKRKQNASRIFAILLLITELETICWSTVPPSPLKQKPCIILPLMSC